MNELVEAAAAPFKVAARKKGILFAIARLNSPVAIVCDRARVELALSNLLDNALKFTPDGGRVEIGAEMAGDRVRLWVQDSGPGIHPDDQPHIFERFYRGGAQAGDGNGLGLAIVKSVAQAHGGRAWVESESAAGSRFVIELPARFTVEHAEHAEKSSPLR